MLKRVLLSAIMLLGLSLPLRAQVWNIDPAHSHVGFTVKHLVISKVAGEFRDFAGTVTFDGQDVSKGAVDVTIQMASINTANDKRDEHLRGADFFEAAKFPTMTFKSKKIIKGDADKFTMIGDLTMKGVTKEDTLDCTFNGVIIDPWGNTRAGFSASTVINRQDYGVAWSNKLADGSLVVGNDITITLEIETIKAK